MYDISASSSSAAAATAATERESRRDGGKDLLCSFSPSWRLGQGDNIDGPAASNWACISVKKQMGLDMGLGLLSSLLCHSVSGIF
jgi:hypothetical protein